MQQSVVCVEAPVVICPLLGPHKVRQAALEGKTQKAFRLTL